MMLCRCAPASLEQIFLKQRVPWQFCFQRERPGRCVFREMTRKKKKSEKRHGRQFSERKTVFRENARKRQFSGRRQKTRKKSEKVGQKKSEFFSERRRQSQKQYINDEDIKEDYERLLTDGPSVRVEPFKTSDRRVPE
jgi:hypothetical protein